ncbi:MAG: zinc ribbon domain-containing protein [Oscillospiraceae bacterium]|nr:zinc ribbon domain-containing protein [Oscillospiraceae bacterium]
MFCPKCGANVPDTSAFCPGCGSSVSSATTFRPGAPSIDTSNYDPTAPRPVSTRSYGSSAKSRGLSKNQYLKTEAPENIKKLAKSTYLLFAVAAILAGLCLFSALTTPFYDLPLFSVVFDTLGTDIEDEWKEEVEDREADETYYRELRDAGYISSAEYESRMDELDMYMEFAEDPTINNVGTLIDETEKRAGILAESDEFAWAPRLYNVVIITLYFITIMIIGFAFLSAYLKSTVSAVFTAIFAALFGFSMSPAILAFLAVVSAIVLAVVCTRINKAYKS